MTYLQQPYFDVSSDWRPTPVPELPSWPKHGRVALDVETYDPEIPKPQQQSCGLGVRHGGFIAGVSVAIEDGPSFYLPYGHQAGDNLPKNHVLSYLRDQAAAFRGTIVGANLPYDLDYLAEDGVVFRRAEWFRDICIAACLINEHDNGYGLEAVLLRNGLPPKTEDHLDEALRAWGLKGKGDLWRLPARHVAEYALGDTELPLRCLRRQEREIEAQELERVWDLESRVLPVTVKIRRRGVRIDTDRLEQVRTWAYGQSRDLLERIRNQTGVRIAVEDLNKKEPIVEALKYIGVTLPRTDPSKNYPDGQPKTDETTLSAIDHPIAEWYVEAKKYDKMRTTFAASILRHMVNGRIHATFKQMRGANEGRADESGAAYGRFSSTHPNLQQQPKRNKKVAGMWRSIYLPDEGALWTSCDYCYDDQTEVLTDRGWTRFPNLTSSDRVAQWDAGAVEYVAPTKRIVGQSPGSMVRIRGQRQVDLLVTPNHRCYYLDHNGETVVQPAECDFRDNWRIPQNGTLSGAKSHDARLAAAVQADASYRDSAYRFFLKKERKIARLRELLKDVPHTSGTAKGKPGFRYFTIPASTVRDYIKPGIEKDFRRSSLLGLSPQSREHFLQETLEWDGSRQSTEYYSSNLRNCEIIQELAVLTGYRSNLTVRTQPDRKPRGVVSLNKKPGTYCKTLTRSTEQYDGRVYCVTVPSGAFLVRRNGRVSVSGNSAQEPRMMVHYAALSGCKGAAEMVEKYREDPRLDLHKETAALVGNPCRNCGGSGCDGCKGSGYDRDAAKIIYLGVCYGMGGAKLCRSLGLPTSMWHPPDKPEGFEVEVAGDEGRALLKQFNQLVPFISGLSTSCENRANKMGFIRTISGRRCRFIKLSKPRKVKGRMVYYAHLHKALNRLIQGGSADQGKQALIDADRAGIRVQIPVHDELCASVANRDEAEQLAQVMVDATPLLVPTIVDVEIGRSWGEAT